MTMSAKAEPLGRRLPSTDEVAAANQLRKILAAQAVNDGMNLRVLEDKTPASVTLTPALSEILMEVLRHIGNGDAVTIVPVSQKLTTQQAADILNVSRPYLIRLLEQGKIAYTTVGRHRRIKAVDLFDYKKDRDATRRKALEELASMDAELL